jgi:hypothetical protein
VERLLSELVYPFANHFIGYDAHPTLDDYFFGVAFREIELMEGYDSFHYSIKFGAVSFQKYKLALTFLMSIGIRHERFAEALVRKDQNIRFEDVLTISSETAPFIESIREAINYFGSSFEAFEEATSEDVATILSVLSISRANTDLLDRPGAPLPLLIQCSGQHLIRCQTAVLADPMQFLLNSLKHHFPREYDTHQRTRESAMQAAIKRVLNGGFAGLEFVENVKLKRSSRTLTDIDLVAAEPGTGVVLLMQLKHQDLFGMDFHARHLRTTRLNEQVERWLEVVKDWAGTTEDAVIRKTLRLSDSTVPARLYRVIVTRHYGYSLGNVAHAPDIAFANWNQFFNAIRLVKQSIDKPGLLDLILKLREGVELAKQAHLSEPRSEWIIGDLKFTTVQEEGTDLR